MATLGLSLDVFCRGLLRELTAEGYDVVAVSSPDASLKRLGEREGVRTVGVNMERRISPLKDLASLVKLVKVMRRERPDMLHTITPKAGLLGMMAAWIARVPVRVHTFTGLLFPTATGWRRHLLRLTDRITCACATHVVPEGEGVKADLIDGDITRKPLRVLGHGNVRGVDLEHYSLTPEVSARAAELRESFGIPEDACVLVFVGRLNTEKGMRELLKAMEHHPECHLLLAGATEGEPTDIDTASLRSSQRIHLSDGWVDDVRPWLAAADALIFPSYREGFPNVVLEAGAMERPSIVTDINGSREIITDGINGLIVPPRQWIPLSQAITDFYGLSPVRRTAMGRGARAIVAQRFSQQYVRHCLKEFYEKILNDRV